MKAFAWQSGLIEFASEVPDGALLIAEGPAKEIRGVVGVWARHSRTGDDLLVPGVPEAESEEAKLDALIAFSFRVKERMAKHRLAS
ncbi:host nuclease inhibitor protein [Burkholderia multivorans]|uniref:host nuclease inhibitor protein n=1 Tax=Burkholderia multivorans TaxID=87883 RepID=UPI001C266AD7|nr:host nuclease inhibitor protein [Burkholderia multivorans]MBU9539400.1 host nuclease inhibitor protein [Burkholderia multivorans]